MLSRPSSRVRSPLTVTGVFSKGLRLLFITVLLAAALGSAPLPVRSVQAAPGDLALPQGLINPDGTLDLSTGFQGTLDLRGWQVSLDPERGPVFEPASMPDAAQAGAWSALPMQGLNNDVYVLAASGSDLYVGGFFTGTGDGTLSNLGGIARYDTATGTWHALPRQGLNGDVYALVVDGSDLYVGGDFTQTGDGTLSNLNGIARYDTATKTWNALPRQGLNNAVLALAVDGSQLYVGGGFSQTGDGTLTLNGIARFNTSTNSWNALPNQGLDNNVLVLALSGNDLYVGGWFTQTGDASLTNLGLIARYNTTANSWHALPNQGLGGGIAPHVDALAVVGSDLYVGGAFTRSGDMTLNLGNIARYNTMASSWNALSNQGLNSRVDSLAVVGSDLYVGGDFTATGDWTLNLGRIASYDTTTNSWSAFPNQGLNDTVDALVMSGGDLYVAGSFAQTGDGALTNLGRIARFRPAVPIWQALSNEGSNGEVVALAVSGSDLYVGGIFTQTGDGTLTGLGNIARYDTTTGTWHPLSRQGLNGGVYVLELDGSDLYLGGSFTATGDNALTNLGNVARYDTTAKTWHALPKQGLDSPVYGLELDGSDLYLGGLFTGTGDATLNLGYIARYNTTAKTWNALPKQGLDNWVQVLKLDGSDLYVGGGFGQTGDGTLTNLGYIARYSTTAKTWHALPNQGFDSWVRVLAVDGSHLYVGGDFTGTGDGTLTNLGRLARYDTTAKTWHALPNQGLNGGVLTLVVNGSHLYVGGFFTQTSDGTLTNLGRIARYDTAAKTWHALPNQGFDDWVRALVVDGSHLYAGGQFAQTGDGALTNLGGIARLPMTSRVFLPALMKK